MALNIKNERVHDLAREAARRAGTSQTSALEAALELYLATLDATPDDRTVRLQRAHDVVRQMRSTLTERDRAAIRADLEALYDDDGLPA